MTQADLGSVTYPTSAQRWTKTPGATRYRPSRLGEHTCEILREWLGTTDSELDELRHSEAIFDPGSLPVSPMIDISQQMPELESIA